MYLNYLQILIKIYESKIKKKKDKKNSLVLLFLQKNKKNIAEKTMFFVGVARLERATACTPCKNASRLHHTPIFESAKITLIFETQNLKISETQK